ncbi:glycosyltransferase [Desulfovibrio sp. UCD-KL4C]|uniref:glycosyltransferase n=1 Tax=Desulfovibrio sp. UCD-KL4C TaxID=2578120 RepID=UPI0025C1039A|nr:glycosyltransferase [Desulfovibrio sp. UCD-KL4C]
MPTIIPNKIHFIWVGNPLPFEQARNFVKWAIENPRYEGVWLWTNKYNIEVNLNILKKILNIDQRVEEVVISSNIEGIDLQISIKPDLGARIFIRSIESLPPLEGSEKYLSKALGEWKNYGMASDILRIWVLYQEGGIYMDFDTYSTGGSLSTGIRAPRDILFGQWDYKERGVDGKLVNAVIAASQSSDELKLLAGFMKRRLDEVIPDSKAQTDLATIDELRVQIRTKKDELSLLQRKLRDSLEPLTLSTTGPDSLAEWFYEQKKMWPQGDETIPYSFQRQSGYNLRIESENTWLR